MTDDAAIDAYQDAFMVMGRDTALRRAKILLRKKEIKQRIAEVYQLAEFDLLHGVELHIKAMREGNYQAIRDYLKMVMPEAPKQVQVDSRHVHATYKRPEDSLPPTMEARALSATIVEDEK